MTYATYSVSTHRRPARSGFSLTAMIVAWRTRQQLKALDDRALADVGITREQAEIEVKRPIWDVPHTWRD